VNNHYTAAAPYLETDGVSAAKLAVNIISQLPSYPQAGGGARKTGGSGIDVTAPVLTNWYQESATGLTAPVYTAPVVYKGVTVISTGNTIECFSSNPGSDLDKDGNPDDGTQDFSLGEPYDLIWTGIGKNGSAMKGPLSTPVCAEVPDGVGGVMDVCLVIDSTGTLYGFNLFPVNGNNQLVGGNNPAMYAVAAPTASTYPYVIDNVTTGQAIPNAPTVSGDLAYIADAVDQGGSFQATSTGRLRHRRRRKRLVYRPDPDVHPWGSASGVDFIADDWLHSHPRWKRRI
jgi:hypothetical protein